MTYCEKINGIYWICVYLAKSYALPQPSHSDDAMQADQGSRIVHVTISKDMVNAFYSYLKGRNDVYALRAARMI